MRRNRVVRVRQKRVTASLRVIRSKLKRADTSRQIYQEDSFASLAVGSMPLAPPYPTVFLDKCVNTSNMLKQCIASMVTNVALAGYDIVQTDTELPIDPDEAEELESFISSANADESLPTVNALVENDYETYGYGFTEVIRDRKQRVSLLRHLLAHQTRLLPRDPEKDRVEVSYELVRGGRTVRVSEYKTYRRFVQIVNGKFRYFQEFGDPRIMDMNTGKYASADNLVTLENMATELIHFKQVSNEPYGIPRWINQLPNILGSREAEECNLRYFEDNTVPPLMLTIAGGRLTGESYRQLTETINKEGVGKDRQNRIMLIEAVPERESLDEKGTVTVNVDKLSDTRQSDGLFKSYDEGNQSKVRSSFRLSGISVGMSSDHTYASANTAMFFAETQVYAPERRMFDEIINKKLINSPEGLNLKTCKLRSKVPPITNSETIIKSMTALNVMGALTPRMCNKAADALLQTNIPDYPEKGEEGYEPWMDIPMPITVKGPDPQEQQSQKDEPVKKLEQEGDPSPKAPEHGQE